MSPRPRCWPTASRPQHRGRAIGVSESGGGAMTLLAAAVTGPLVECTSLPAAGIVAVLIAVVPLLMLGTFAP